MASEVTTAACARQEDRCHELEGRFSELERTLDQSCVSDGSSHAHQVRSPEDSFLNHTDRGQPKTNKEHSVSESDVKSAEERADVGSLVLRKEFTVLEERVSGVLQAELLRVGPEHLRALEDRVTQQLLAERSRVSRAIEKTARERDRAGTASGPTKHDLRELLERVASLVEADRFRVRRDEFNRFEETLEKRLQASCDDLRATMEGFMEQLEETRCGAASRADLAALEDRLSKTITTEFSNFRREELTALEKRLESATHRHVEALMSKQSERLKTELVGASSSPPVGQREFRQLESRLETMHETARKRIEWEGAVTSPPVGQRQLRELEERLEAMYESERSRIQGDRKELQMLQERVRSLTVVERSQDVVHPKDLQALEARIRASFKSEDLASLEQHIALLKTDLMKGLGERMAAVEVMLEEQKVSTTAKVQEAQTQEAVEARWAEVAMVHASEHPERTAVALEGGDSGNRGGKVRGRRGDRGSRYSRIS